MIAIMTNEDEISRRVKEIRENELIEELRITAERLTILADRLESRVEEVEGINDAGLGGYESGAGREDHDPRGSSTYGDPL